MSTSDLKEIMKKMSEAIKFETKSSNMKKNKITPSEKLNKVEKIDTSPLKEDR